MGGAQSLFAENDWNLADGGLDPTAADETIDGAAPTTAYQTYFLVKKAVLANQREFDVLDATGSNLLFHVRPSLGTIAGFDVLGAGSATTDEYLLRVTVDIARRQWIVYRFDKPVFEGQKPDQAATMRFAVEQQTDRKELAARISASLTVHSFHGDGSDPAQPPPVPKHFLYKVCCVTVSWSRYMAVTAYFGPPTLEQLMQSKKHNDAVQELFANADDGDDDIGGDLLLQASHIAGRMRDRRSLADDLMDDESESDVNVVAATTTTNEVTDTPVSPGTKHAALADNEENSIADVVADVISSVALVSPSNEELETTNARTDEIEPTQPQTSPISDDQPNSTTDAKRVETEGTSHQNSANDRTDAVSTMETSLIVSADSVEIIDPSSTTLEEQSNKPSLDTIDSEHTTTVGQPVCTNAINEEDKDVNDDGDDNDHNDNELKSSQSMPERTSESYAAHHADKLLSWFNETSRTIQTKSKSIMRRTNSFDDADSAATRNNYAAFLGINKSTDCDDPLEGVIHLEKPLLLCQEIYTRIIGNHQTSRVSKDIVLKLLKQDMEHRVDDHASIPDKDDSSNGSPVSSKKGIEIEEGKASETNPATEASSEECKESIESTTIEGEKELNAASSPTEKKEQPLVGYWAWEHSLRTHKIKMHLAKGSDLALHVVLAVLVNQVRYERNAIAIAV